MAHVIPFRGIHYSNARVSGADVTAPPYDIINPGIRDELYAKSPYNIVRIDSGKALAGDGDGANRYTRARGYLRDWMAEGVLLRSERPEYYAYEMEYSFGGETRKLMGFYGLVKITELGGGVYPHEATHSKPIVDRTTLMTVCGANTSPIYSIYRSTGGGAVKALEAVRAKKPYLQSTDSEGSTHRFWPVRDDETIKEITEGIKGAEIFIADGHHRYETALYYRNEMRGRDGIVVGPDDPGGPNDSKGDEPYDYVLMFLADMQDEGVSILPTHRLFRAPENFLELISGRFDVRELSEGRDCISAIAAPGCEGGIGLYFGGKEYLIRYTGDALEGIPASLVRLGVVVLHEVVFKRILGIKEVGYEMDYELTKSMARDGENYNAAAFLNPTTVGEVESVALSGERMPPKSTYFYPKIRTGFVLNSFDKS